MQTLVLLDWIVVAVYFCFIAYIVWWSSRKQNTAEDYFLAGRDIGWFAIGGSLFASNIGSEHIVGLAGQGASTGLAMAHYELHAWIIVMLAWVFVPYYYHSRVFTMPEFLERRFSPKARWVLSLVSLVAYVFTKVSVTVYAGALVFQTLLPDAFGSPENAFWVGAVATVVLTGIYTVLGGLRAVIYTDAAQAIILLIGSIAITYFGLDKLGGWGVMQEMCKEQAGHFALWRPLSDPNFPWLGILIASPIIGIWYWCTDQYIVQRTLSARNLTQARRGALFGGLLKLSPVLIFLVPGLMGWALHQKGIIHIPTKLVNGAAVLNGDQVFPTMVASLLPAGLRGVVVAGLLAALMSSLSALFNSAASLYTVDIYNKLWPGASQQKLVRVGRYATAVVVGLGLIWIPVMPMISGGGLYQYLQSVQSYLAPPIAAVFLLGIFWRRINAKGAIWGLILGFVLGMLKITIQAIFGQGKVEHPVFLAAIGDFNFLYFAGVLFAVSILIIILVSLTAPPPADEQLKGLTFATRTAKEKEENRASWNWVDVVATIAVLGGVLAIYLYFSFWLN
jgi:solute:Na+ symporter, SSS family